MNPIKLKILKKLDEDLKTCEKYKTSQHKHLRDEYFQTSFYIQSLKDYIHQL